MEKVRWGLLSTANINRRLIPAIRASHRSELVAVASRDPSNALAYAKKWEIPRAFGSYQAMLDSDQVDAVYVSLPNHLHAEWSIKAMQSGKHVLCEKPFAITLPEVDAMIAASQQTNRVLAEAFMYRHHPQTKIAGEWAQGGKLGDILLVQGIFNFYLSKRDNVRLNPEYGGGCLWDVGVYPMSFAQYIYGDVPERVSGEQRLGETAVDEVFIGHMKYSNGGLAQIASSFLSPIHTYIEIIGSEGRLTLNHPFIMLDQNRHLMHFPKDGDLYEIPVPEVELYSGEVEDFQNAILDGATPYISLEETRKHIQTVLALYQSAREHKTVILER